MLGSPQFARNAKRFFLHCHTTGWQAGDMRALETVQELVNLSFGVEEVRADPERAGAQRNLNFGFRKFIEKRLVGNFATCRKRNYCRTFLWGFDR
jgi:hypothetical protein